MGSPQESLRRHSTAFSALIAVIVGSAALLSALNLFGGSLGLLLAGGNIERVNLASCLFAVACAAVTFLVSRQALCNSFSMRFLRLLCILYLVALVWVALFKSVGVRDINLDPSDVLSQMRDAPESLLTNLLMFIPFGALIWVGSRRMTVLVAASLGTSLAFELAQYAFSLGIFDVIDIAANVIGSTAGFVTIDLLHAFGLNVTPAEPGYVRISRSRHYAASPRRPIVAIAAACLCAACFAAFVSSRLLVTGAPSDWTFPAFSPGPTLAALSERAATTPSSDGEVTVGDSPSEDVITLDAWVLGSVSWTSNDGTSCQGIDVLIEDELPNGVRFSRTLPAVITERSGIQVENGSISLEEASQLLAQSTWWSARVTLVQEDGWLSVSKVKLIEARSNASDLDAPAAPFPWESYDNIDTTSDAEKIAGIANGSAVPVRGYVTSQFVPEDGPGTAVLCIPGNFLGVPIVDAYEVGVGQPRELGAERVGDAEHPVTFELLLRDSALEMADYQS